MFAKEILKDLVAIDTIADKNNNQYMDYMENFFRELKFDVKRLKNSDGSLTVK